MKRGRRVIPISKRKDGYYWGSKGPFDSRKKAEDVAQAAHASGFVEKHFDDRKLASPPKPPTPHHHHRIDPKEADLKKAGQEEWEDAHDPDYKADDRFAREERKSMKPLPIKTIREFLRRQKEQEKADIAQGIKSMPELYVNYPNEDPPYGMSVSGHLAHLATQGGERPETPGDKIPPIPVDTQRTFNRGLGMRAFGPEEHRTDYPRNKTEWKLTNVQNAVSKLIKLVKAEDEYSFDTHWMDRAHLPGGPLESEDVAKLKSENSQYEDNLKNGRSMPYSQHAYHHNNVTLLHNHASDLELPQDASPPDGVEFPSDGPNKVRLGHSYDIDSLEGMDKKHGDIDISTFHNLINHPYRFGSTGPQHPAKGSTSRTEPFKIGADISTPGAMLHNTLNNRFAELWNVNNELGKKPPLSEGQFKAIQNMFARILKEGDGGAGIDGLSGVVFTSENAGVFTPTHGGHYTTAKKRESIKREHDKKRKKLLGKQKKNGVDRLEQFVKKAVQELPLQRIKNMSGRAGTEYAPTHQSGDRKQLDYKKEGEKRTMGEDLQPNASLSGLHSSMEQGRQATEPQSEDISVSRQDIPKRQKWNDNNAVVVKYSPGSITSLGSQPDQNPEAEPPQYIERGKSKAENKNQQQDVKMNDITNKVKKLSDEDADVEQPAGAVSMAVREVNKQISPLSPWGSGGSIDRDELKRGGDLDELEDGEEAEPTESELVINAIKRLQERKQKHLDKGADDALFLAMMEDVDAV